MAMVGTVSSISMEGIIIKTAQREDRYRFDIPYTTQKGQYLGNGASWAVIDKNGDYKFSPGDSVSFSYDSGPEGLYLKFIEKTGGAPQQNYSPQQDYPPKQNYSAPPPTPSAPQKSFGGDNKTQEIYYQHAQKIATEFLCAFPEIITDEYAAKDGTLDKYLVFVEKNQQIADLLTQGFCLRFGIDYFNKLK